MINSIEAAAITKIGSKTRSKCKHLVSERSRSLLKSKEDAYTELSGITDSQSERAKSLKAELKILEQRVTESLAEDERTKLEIYIKQLEEADRKHDARSTWRVIKKFAGKDKKRLIRVRSNDGPFSDKNILSEWWLYFRDLLNAETDNFARQKAEIE